MIYVLPGILQGPVLSARQALVAKKLEEEAGEQKEKKDTKREKKEVLSEKMFSLRNLICMHSQFQPKPLFCFRYQKFNSFVLAGSGKGTPSSPVVHQPEGKGSDEVGNKGRCACFCCFDFVSLHPL